MSIDVFGHGLRYLPTANPEYYSDGPDRKRGPSKCRGSEGGCYDGVTPTPHDHSCCCDPCRHTFVDTCGTGHCCRCIPKQICALFTPDTPAGTCAAKSWTMEPSTSGDRSTYSFAPNGDTIELSVGKDADGYPGGCTWRLYSAALSIDESQAIDHSGAIHCQAPPAFTIENVNLIKYDSAGTPSDCYGTITFTEKTLAKVPFIYKWQGLDEFATISCGSCSQICQILCVRRGNEYDPTTYTRVDFLWDQYAQRWNADDDSGHYLTLFEEYGFCLFYVAHQQNTGPQTVKCTVARVVDGETDEPVANERYKRPYTVLHYQPAYAVFDLPGDLGQPGQNVYVVPPDAE